MLVVHINSLHYKLEANNATSALNWQKAYIYIYIYTFTPLEQQNCFLPLKNSTWADCLVPISSLNIHTDYQWLMFHTSFSHFPTAPLRTLHPLFAVAACHIFTQKNDLLECTWPECACSNYYLKTWHFILVFRLLCVYLYTILLKNTNELHV